MSLKTFVKVGKITNLSDARYCSGMGVDMLGFRVIPSDADYLTPERFKEFRGWFTGPTVVAEAFGIQSSEEIATIIDNYQPDFIELSVADLKNVKISSLPIILSGTADELREVKRLSSSLNIEYLIFTNIPTKEITEQLNASYKLLVEVKEEKELDSLEGISPLITGISLHGSPEEKPGLKNYELLSAVLEKLEALD
jgi:phosphoribosylanthranilate isomerase